METLSLKLWVLISLSSKSLFVSLAPTIARFNSVNQYITNLLARFSEEAARESSITDVAERFSEKQNDIKFSLCTTEKGSQETLGL